MKLLLVLLACVAASNASSISSYSYYCRSNFHVYPASSSYRYSVYSPSTWCSSRYYTTILKVYPEDTCGQAGWRERSVADVIEEVKNLLKSSLVKMTRVMQQKRDEFVSKLDQVHDQYKANFKRYLSMHYTYTYGRSCGSYYISQRDERIRAYNQKLDDIRADIIKKYNKSIGDKIEMISNYHKNIVKNSTDCLESRNTKIGQYKASLKKTIDGYGDKFHKYHYGIALKNRDHYKSILSSLYSSDNSWWIGFKAQIAVSYYYNDQCNKVYAMVRDYRSKLETYKQQLIAYYTCAYRCSMTNSSLRFYSRSYYSHCRSLGRWYSYKSTFRLDRYRIREFKYTFPKSNYKSLKTCDVVAAAGSASALVIDFRKKMDDTLAAQNREFIQWKSTWIGYHLRYKRAFEQIVNQRHNWIYMQRVYYLIRLNGCLYPPQYRELSALRKSLDAKRDAACREYYGKLGSEIVKCFKRHKDEQSQYKKRVESFISRIPSMFDRFIVRRTAAIAAYKKKLEQSRDEKRKSVLNKAYESKNAHWRQYHVMLKHFHGASYLRYFWINWMTGCYASQLVQRCSHMMNEFDAYWRDLLPKLVQHYACSYKNHIENYSVPYSCGSYYDWKFNLPTLSAYSYQYVSYSRRS